MPFPLAFSPLRHWIAASALLACVTPALAADVLLVGNKADASVTRW